MKIILQILFALCVVSCISPEKEINTSLIESGAELTIIGEETIDFGKVVEGEKVHLEFKIKNSGTGNLIISKASASCGCTSLEYPEEVLSEGESDVVKVTFDSKGRVGNQIKKITLVSNTTPNIKILTIKGVVVPFEN